tara:strand:- start:838 stop:1923 length:1086 start_codon:yes stop_codon:yes gene_type:complete
MANIRVRCGKYVVQIRKGKHSIHKTFTRKRDAEEFIIDTESLIQSGAIFKDKAPLPMVLDWYLKEYEDNLSKDQISMLLRAQEELGQYSLHELDAKVIESWVLNMKNAKNKKKTPAPSTRLKRFVQLKSILQHAADVSTFRPMMDEFRKSAAKMNKKKIDGHPIMGDTQERDRRLTDNELKRIISAAPTKDERFGLIVWFAVHTSMRMGEILKLQWNDLSENGRTILVRDRKHPKRKHTDRVPLLPQAQDIINQMPRAAVQIFPLAEKSITRNFSEAVKRIQKDDPTFEHARFHDTRHEAISRLFEMGLHTTDVQKFSGHRSLDNLMRYTHLNAEEILDSLSMRLSTTEPSSNPRLRVIHR